MADEGTDSPLAKTGVVVAALDFRTSYRKAGGKVDLHLFEGVGEAFITNDPNSLQARDAIEKIIEFVHRELG